jgi:hypothetical protein
VLGMTTGQIRNPITRFVFMKADDFCIHASILDQSEGRLARTPSSQEFLEKRSKDPPFVKDGT